MTLLEEWQKKAYNREADQGTLKKLWDDYFEKEKGVYEILLTDPDNVVKGTVKELAERFNLDILTMTGFLDGINESVITPNPIETMDENTEVSLAFDKERLYRNMVKAEADWLYNLPQWDHIFDEEKRHELYMTQKKSGTYVKEKKVGRNDPCPCGSGMKYKNCCMKKDQEAERARIAEMNQF
ncbi:MAG: SEC-C domain-containing protein [Lachnospiraceae bacterium]|nr:SEC-C domain-containing protein [Lachnospiraceae bacterium]